MNAIDASRFIAEAFLIVLGREISPIELRDTLRGFHPDAAGALVVRLLSSPEFRILHDALVGDGETGRDLEAQERAFRGIGANDEFVQLAYRLLLGRPADDSGRAHYAEAL